MKAGLAVWAANRIIRAGGWPHRVFEFFGGIGDDLLLGAALERLGRENPRERYWVVSKTPELFHRHPAVRLVLHADERTNGFLASIRKDVVRCAYLDAKSTSSVHIPPTRHILCELAVQCGVKDIEGLRPRMWLTDAERRESRFARGAIAIHSGADSARFGIPTKNWFPERFAQVVAAFSSRRFIQLGCAEDPLIAGAEDFRGMLSLRQSAAVLANCDAFVGQVGGLMHLARAVDCPSVIVYGGRELPSQSGYETNINLTGELECSPCWLVHSCPHDMACMRAIPSDRVIRSLRESLKIRGLSFDASSNV